MEVVSDVRCAPQKHPVGIVFADILYQRRLRSISELVFRNIDFPQVPISKLNVRFKSPSGHILHYGRDLETRHDFIYRNFNLLDTEFDSLLSTKIFIVELYSEELLVHTWIVNISDLIFIGSLAGSGGEYAELSPSQFVGSSIYYLSSLQFKPNSLILVFNDSFYCSAESISDFAASDHSQSKTEPGHLGQGLQSEQKTVVYPNLSAPLLSALKIDFSHDKCRVLDEHRLRMIHTNALLVQQRRHERNQQFGQNRTHLTKTADVQSKLEKIEYLSRRTATMVAEKTRLTCENQNQKLIQQEKKKLLAESELSIRELEEDNVNCQRSRSTLRQQLADMNSHYNLVRKKKQLVRGYLLHELQGIFSISEKHHFATDSKGSRMGSLFQMFNMTSPSGRGQTTRSLNRDRNMSAEDGHWYICGLWLPKSEVFDPWYQQQVSRNGGSSASRSIDVSKVDDFEIVTAVCYVAWVLVIISQISASVLRYQIDVSSPCRWFVVDNQIDLLDEKESREYDLVLDRKLRVKDDFRFLHALLCINKNIGQLRYKLNLTQGTFTIHKTLRDLNLVLKFLSNRKLLQDTYKKVRTASIPIPKSLSLKSLDPFQLEATNSFSPASVHNQKSISTGYKVSMMSNGNTGSSASTQNLHRENNLDDDLEAMMSANEVSMRKNQSESFLAHSSASTNGLATKQSYKLNLNSNQTIAKVQFSGILSGTTIELNGESSSAGASFRDQEGDGEDSSSGDEMMVSAAAMAANQSRQAFSTNRKSTIQGQNQKAATASTSLVKVGNELSL